MNKQTRNNGQTTSLAFALSLAIALLNAGHSNAQTAVEGTAPPHETDDRISAFYFNQELEEAVTPVVMLHASAIQMSVNGKSSVWINGTELSINDRYGPVQIVAIEPSAALLRINREEGRARTVRLAMNQSLSLDVLTVQEGVTTTQVRAILPKTRLP